MNKSIIIRTVTILLISISLFGCKDDCNDVFDGENPSARLEKRLRDTRTVLSEAPNGWIMKMYPSSNLKYGGYNVLVKFDSEGKLNAKNELFPVATPNLESYYSLNGSNGPCITFNTYNQAIHFFSEPDNSFFDGKNNVSGDGDLVFRIISSSPEKVVLQGLRSDVMIELVPFPKDTDWTGFVEKVSEVSRKVSGLSYSLIVNGREMPISLNSNSYRIFTLEDGTTLPFIYTQTGIEFFEPVTIDGITVKTLTMKSVGNAVSLVSEDGNFVLRKNKLNLAESIVTGMWFMSRSNSGLIGGDIIADVAEFSLNKLNDRYGVPYIFLGYNEDQVQGPGFAVWSRIRNADGSRNYAFKVPLKYTLYPDNSNKITIEYAPEALKDQTNSKTLNGVGYNILAAPFAHIGNVANFDYRDSVGPRTFEISADDEYSPTKIILKEIGVDNTIVLSSQLILNPAEK